MKEWVEHCRGFMEHCAMTVELRLASDHGFALQKIGTIDRKVTSKLGKNTVAIRVLKRPVACGDHVVMKAAGSIKKVARIDSIMSNGSGHDHLPLGHREVAIGLSKPHQLCELFQTP
jgi:deoxyribose-phosphate aldolase